MSGSITINKIKIVAQSQDRELYFHRLIMLRRHRELCLSIDLRARSVVVGSDRPDSRATSQARKGRWGSRSFGRGAFVHSSFCALCARLSRDRGSVLTCVACYVYSIDRHCK